jgi:hypothetical protein
MAYSGKIYDSEETKMLRQALNQQSDIFSSIDKEKKIGDSSLLRYAIIGAGVVLLIVVFRKLIK